MFRRSAGLVLSIPLAFVAVKAQAAGSQVTSGEKLAQQYCTQCHVIVSGGGNGWTNAPSFQEIADTKGFTARSLSAFIQQPHTKMVNVGRSPEDSDALAAYILSLRSQ